MSILKFGLLVSGQLGATCIEHVYKEHQVDFVMTDTRSLIIIELCKKLGVPVFTGNPRNGNAGAFLNQFKADVLLSINYLFIIDKEIIIHPKKYAINIHGSLLPKYRGRTPHVWAIINNETEIGITAHLISEGCDDGDIVFQKKINILKNDTGAAVLEVFIKDYPQIVSALVEMISKNKLNQVPQDHGKATYFGKRTPEDGEINWNWQKERIYNWVRALANPYPGAFTFYNNRKLIIHKIEYSDFGFNYEDSNGKILNAEELIVKTSNGAIKLLDIQMAGKIIFKTGQQFNARF